jgi:hypothetical protein
LKKLQKKSILSTYQPYQHTKQAKFNFLMNKIKIINIFSLILLSINLFAQKNKNNGGISGGSVDVEATYKATLLESEKVKTDFSLPSLDTSIKAQKYELSQRTFKVDYLPPKLRPIAMGTDKKDLKDIKNGYVKVGYGVPASPYGEASYAFRQEKLQALVSLNHYSIKSKQNELMRYSNTGGRVSGNYYLNKNYALGGYVGYNQERPNYYAIETNPTNKKTSQKFKLFDIGTSIFNIGQTATNFTYGAGLDIYRLGDDYGSKEIGAKIEGKATKWFADKHPLSVALKGDFSSFTSSAAERRESLNNLYIQPSFTFHGGAFYAQIGANLASNSDEWTPFPMLELSVNALGNKLAIFGGWKGDLKKNTYRTMTDFAPFLNFRISELLPANAKLANTSFYDYYGGVKGHWGKVDYNFQGGYRPTDNLAVFRNDVEFTDGNSKRLDTITLHTVYTDVDITYLKGTIAAELFKGFELSATIAQNIYKMKDSAGVNRPYHLPASDITAMAKYRTLENKLLLKGQLFFQNGVPYFNAARPKDNLGALLDLSFGSEFNINNMFSVWLDVNNVLNNKRERWVRYPNFGINVLGGLKVKF